jgi:hypothetical protein
MEFDPTLKKADDDLKLARYIEKEKLMKEKVSSSEFKAWKKKHKKKFIKDKYEPSTRQVSAVYNKRVMSDCGFFSRPHNIVEKIVVGK